MEDFFFGFLTLETISFLKNNVSLNDYFFLIQQVISQSLLGLTLVGSSSHGEFLSSSERDFAN